MTLNDRIEAALKRITEGRAPMRIPADETDPDLVLAAAQKRIEELEAQVARHAEQLRRVAEAVKSCAYDYASAHDPTGRAARRINHLDLDTLIAEALK